VPVRAGGISASSVVGVRVDRSKKPDQKVPRGLGRSCGRESSPRFSDLRRAIRRGLTGLQRCPRVDRRRTDYRSKTGACACALGDNAGHLISRACRGITSEPAAASSRDYCFESVRLVGAFTRPNTVRSDRIATTLLVYQPLRLGNTDYVGKADQQAAFPTTPHFTRLTHQLVC
jgi:hypothetical protein